MAWLAALDGVHVENLLTEQVDVLHAQWQQIATHPDWPDFPAPLRAECCVLATQVALVAGDVPAAQASWRAAIAARPDNYGLRASLADVESIGAATATADLVALTKRLRDAVQRTPLARPDANGVYRRLDRI